MFMFYNSRKQRTYDYLIVGGGLFGSATAEQLIKSHPGASILLIDADSGRNPDIPRSSIGHARLSRCVSPETPEYFQTLSKSIPALKQDAGFFSIDLCTLWKNGDINAENAISQLKLNDVKHEIINDPIRLREIFSIYLQPGYKAVIEQGGEQAGVGLFDPSKAVQNWQTRAKSFGVEIIGAKVCGLQNKSVILEDGTKISANTVIVAAGSQTPKILPEMNGLIVPQPVPLIYVEIDQTFPDGCILWIDPKGLGADLFCMTDKLDSGQRVLKAGFHITNYSGRKFENKNTEELSAIHAQIEAELRKHVHGIGKVIHSEICYYGNTLSGLPYIGEVVNGIYVFAGGNGSCAKHAYGLAGEFVNMVVGKKPEINMEPFKVPFGKTYRAKL